MATSKSCITCGEPKPLDAFYLNPKTVDVRDPRCKTCVLRYEKEYREKNAEKIKERRAAHYAKNRAKILARNRAYKEKHRKELAAYTKNRREKMPDIVAAEARRGYRRRVRAGRSFTTAERDYLEVLRQDPCAYCGKPGDHLDHIVPLARGGEGDWTNLTSACRQCNQSKSARSLLSYLSEVA